MDDFNNKNIFNSNEEKDLDSNIINKTEEIKTNKPFSINMKKNIIKRKNIHNDFGHHLTYNKKLSCELDSLPKNINQFFRKSLDKYKFQMEVYVPQSMRISKKEYYDKNYMLNNLVRTQFKIEGEKNKISKIAKETKKFSNQYKLVKSDNQNKQKEYLLNLEKEYKNKKMKEITYKKDENIFTPSFLLDTNYGNNLESDMYKYGQNNDFYLDESKRDEYLLQKFYDVINRKDQKEENNQLIIENKSEEEDKIKQIKNELKEQLKIQNMTRKEYFNYSNKLKKEINKIKGMIMIENGNKTNFKIKNNSTDFNEFDKKTKNEKNILAYTYRSTGEKNKVNNKPNNLKKEKNKIVLSEINLSNKENEGRKKPKKNNKNNIIENKTKSNLIDKIPKLILKKVNPKKGETKETKEFKLNQLYNTLSTRLNSKNSEMPYKQMNQYFMKYSPKKLPKVNVEKGSNIHGLVESAQNIINDNNIIGFSKLNESLKKDIFDNNKINENFKNKGVETENIINLDKKILGLHYEFADSLLSNKRDKYLKIYNK